jgi:pimeloyl-ACP methyl ester carboxylesterase
MADSDAPPMTPFPVTVHQYPTPTSPRGSCAYEYHHSSPPSSSSSSSPKNAVIFVGGLGDGPHTVPFVRTVADRLGQDGTWSVFESRLTSSFGGYAFSSLAQDVDDISALVEYLRRIGKNKIVLLGHSTGSQDCVEYANYAKHNNEPVDGFVLQGPVSDREGLWTLDPAPTVEAVYEALATAEKMIVDGHADDPMPMDKIRTIYTEPISAYRFHSLLAKGGDDDFFSTDLDPEATKAVWSRFDKPVLIMYSAEDRFVPAHVDKAAVVEGWKALNPLISPLSGLIPKGGHDVVQREAQVWLADRVASFLESV